MEFLKIQLPLVMSATSAKSDQEEALDHLGGWEGRNSSAAQGGEAL